MSSMCSNSWVAWHVWPARRHSPSCYQVFDLARQVSVWKHFPDARDLVGWSVGIALLCQEKICNLAIYRRLHFQVEELAAALNAASDRLSVLGAEQQRLMNQACAQETQLAEATSELQQLR